MSLRGRETPGNEHPQSILARRQAAEAARHAAARAELAGRVFAVVARRLTESEWSAEERRVVKEAYEVYDQAMNEATLASEEVREYLAACGIEVDSNCLGLQVNRPKDADEMFRRFTERENG